jgi:hypothetical protein
LTGNEVEKAVFIPLRRVMAYDGEESARSLLCYRIIFENFCVSEHGGSQKFFTPTKIPVEFADRTMDLGSNLQSVPSYGTRTCVFHVNPRISQKQQNFRILFPGHLAD